MMYYRDLKYTIIHSSTIGMRFALILSIVFMTSGGTRYRTVGAYGLDCTMNSDCDIKYRGKSICVNRKCSNPFEKGCLKTMEEFDINITDEKKKLLEDTTYRVCNSDDYSNDSSDDVSCGIPSINYTEIRISPGNWDIAMIVGWVHQIILSEMLGVPTTIVGSNGTSSFYNQESTYKFPDYSYPVEHLREADRFDGDCSLTNEPCAHMLPDVWEGGLQKALDFQKNGTVLTSEANGVNGRFGFYVPISLIRNHTSLSSMYGFRSNRKKLADTFLTPTTWDFYCNRISSSGCSESDGIAEHAPSDEEEKLSYFKEGSYKGHFRRDDSNDCEKFPNDCTGNVIVPTCDWSIYSEAQFFWNKIFLTSNGPNIPNGGYNSKQIKDIYHAANATKSAVIIWWWEPDELFDLFYGDDYELYRIALGRPNMKCLQYRRNGGIDKCSTNLTERHGEIIGSCDQDIEAVQKLLSRGLLTITQSKVDALQNPAHDLIKRLLMPAYGVDEIFQTWIDREGSNNPFVDSKREGVCEFVYNNLEKFHDYLPKGYPRQITEENYRGLSVFAFVVGVMTLIATIVIFCIIFVHRNNSSIKTALIETLYQTVIGYSFIAIAAICAAVTQTDRTCIMTQWLTRIGYTLGTIPILIKVSAINKLSRDGRNLRKSKNHKNRLKRKLLLPLCCMIVYLAIWTAVDSPRYKVRHVMNVNNEAYVKKYDTCSSENISWESAAFCWEAIMLVSATAIAYEARGVIDELNFSRPLVVMVYSHFLFLCMRLLTTVLMFSDRIPAPLARVVISLLQSFDTCVASSIYLLPIIITACKKSEEKLAQVVTVVNKTGKKKMHISGIKIPVGGIPNLRNPPVSAGDDNGRLTTVTFPLKSSTQSKPIHSSNEIDSCSFQQRRKSITRHDCDLSFLPEEGTPLTSTTKDNQLLSANTLPLGERHDETERGFALMADQNHDDDDDDKEKMRN